MQDFIYCWKMGEEGRQQQNESVNSVKFYCKERKKKQKIKAILPSEMYYYS